LKGLTKKSLQDSQMHHTRIQITSIQVPPLIMSNRLHLRNLGILV
jgi:hypothetical protein